MPITPTNTRNGLMGYLYLSQSKLPCSFQQCIPFLQLPAEIRTVTVLAMANQIAMRQMYKPYI